MLRNVKKSRDFAPQAKKNGVNLMFFEEKSGYFPPCFGRSENKGGITYGTEVMATTKADFKQ